MAKDASKVRVAVTGGVYHGPTGTALPTTAVAVLNVAFKDVGYISEDGITQTTDADTEKIKAWQNGDTIRSVQTSHAVSFQLTMIETTDETQSVYYGQTVSGGTVLVNGAKMPIESFVFEIKDGSTDIRIVIPNGQITERGDVVYKNDEPIGYEVTIECFPDASGNKAYIYQAPSVTVSSVAINGPATVSSGSIYLNAVATRSDASTMNVTQGAVWVSSDPAKATVDQYGVVTKVAAGTTNITAAYGGQMSTPKAITVS